MGLDELEQQPRPPAAGGGPDDHRPQVARAEGLDGDGTAARGGAPEQRAQGRLAPQRRVGDRRDVPVVAQLVEGHRQGELHGAPALHVRLAPGELLHRPLGRDPGPAARRPARAVVHGELEAQAGRLADRVSFSANHSGPRYSTGPFGMPVPASKLITPPTPTRLMASRSRVMPSRVTCPFIQCQSTHGRAESGGCEEGSLEVGGEPAARAARGDAYATTPVATVPLRKSRRDGFFAGSRLPWVDDDLLSAWVSAPHHAASPAAGVGLRPSRCRTASAGAATAWRWPRRRS